MNIFVDCNTHTLVQGIGVRAPLNAIEIKSQDTLAVNIFILSGGVVQDLGESPTLKFALVASTAPTVFLVYEDVFTRQVDPVNGVFYQCFAIFNTTQMATALATASPLSCILEIRVALSNTEIIHTLNQLVTVDRTILVEGGTPAATVIAVYPDPSVLEVKSNKDQPSGYPSLDSARQLTPSVIPIDGSTIVLTDGKLSSTTGGVGPEGPAGAAGIAGPQGVAGPQGIQGIPGIQGVQGPVGTGLTPKGTVSTSSALPTSGNTVGDLWVAEDTAHGWTWSGTAWTDLGPLQGPTGSVGPAGPAGSVGLTGAASVVPGPTGPAGIQGIQGVPGVTGPTGLAGGVTSIVAGTNVTITPTSGLGDVTINAAGGGGGGGNAAGVGFDPSGGADEFDDFLAYAGGSFKLGWTADINSTTGVVSQTSGPGVNSQGAAPAGCCVGAAMFKVGVGANDVAGIWLGDLVNGSIRVDDNSTTGLSTYIFRASITPWEGTYGGAPNFMFGIAKHSSGHPTLTPDTGLWFRNDSNGNNLSNHWTLGTPGQSLLDTGIANVANQFHTFKITINPVNYAVLCTINGVAVASNPSLSVPLGESIVPFCWVINNAGSAGNTAYMLVDYVRIIQPISR